MSYNSLFGLGTYARDVDIRSWWKLQDDAATTAIIDSSGKGQSGTFTENTNADKPTAGPTNWLTTSLNFDGNDSIYLGSKYCPASFSFTGWVYYPGSTGYQTVITAFDTGVGAWLQLYTQSSSLTGRIHQVRDTTYIGRGSPITQAAWSHVAMTWNGGTTNAAVKLFVNGVQTDNADNGAGTFTAPYSGAVRNYIGAQYAGAPSTHWTGRMAECTTWNKALTLTEIGEILSGPEPLNLIVPSAPIGPFVVGNTLTADNGTWDSQNNGTLIYSYQWYRSDDNAGTNRTLISGATNSTYTLQAADEHKYVQVKVRASNGGGYDDAEDKFSDFAPTGYKHLLLPESPASNAKVISDNMKKLADQEGRILQMDRDPLASDGRSVGCYQFSRWLNTTTKSIFICLDDNNPYAVWEQMNKLYNDVSPTLGGDLQTGNYAVRANRLTSDTALSINATSNIKLANYTNNGTGTWFVKIPSISNTVSTTFYVYYGNSSASDTQSPTNVWDSNFKAVHHLDEPVGDAADNFQDSTSNVNHAYVNGAGTCYSVNGHMFERALGISTHTNPNGHIYTGLMGTTAANNIDNVNTISASMWVFPLAHIYYNRFLERYNPSSFFFGYVDPAVNSGAIGLLLRGGTWVITPNNTVLTNRWTHVGFTYNSAGGTNNAKIYVNGAVAAQGTYAGPLLADSWPLGIGNSPHYRSDGGNNPLDGIIEEVRYSTSERSTAWMNFEYTNTHPANVAGTGNLIFVGEEEATSAISGYSYRRQVTINYAHVTATLTNFPLYLRLNRILPYDKVRSDGYDVIFADSNGTTLLSFERMFWSPPNYDVQANYNDVDDTLNRSATNVGNLTSIAPYLQILSNDSDYLGTSKDITITASPLVINSTTLPSSDGTAYQVLKCNGSGGLSWSNDVSIPVGSIWFFGADTGTVPPGYLICEGGSVDTTTYAALFNVIGYWYGGSGASFTLPDFRQRMAVHPDGSTEFPTITSGSVKTGGSITVTLDTSTMPPHWHQNTAGSGAGGTYKPLNASTGTGVNTSATTGGGGAHNNLPPYCVVKYMIKY